MDTESSDRITQAIAAELRAARGRKNITRDELADRAGVGRSTVWRIEKAEREVKMSQLYALCEVLGVTPSTLLQAAQDALRDERD
jgi:transcriptional regulator with XRE-family HTH domain